MLIQYTGVKAKFFHLYKQRARCFHRAFLLDDLRELQIRDPKLIYLLDWDKAQVKCVWMKVCA